MRELAIALHILQYLEVPVAKLKTVGPATQLLFLGILIDKSTFELRLLADKIQHLQEMIGLWSSKKIMYKEEVGIIPWEFVSCCLSVATGTYFPPPTFQHITPGKSIYHYIYQPGPRPM